ncbi:MAG: hypothetical protein U0132_22350 [Gemmatimonadaceae bacterium]
MMRSTSCSTMLVPMTLSMSTVSAAFPNFFCIASASLIKSMSAVTESTPRSFAISATVLPAYAGLGRIFA